jgi:hypothetical protein
MIKAVLAMSSYLTSKDELNPLFTTQADIMPFKADFKFKLTLIHIRCTINGWNWNPIVYHNIAVVMFVIISNEYTLYFLLLGNLANGTYL